MERIEKKRKKTQQNKTNNFYAATDQVSFKEF